MFIVVKFFHVFGGFFKGHISTLFFEYVLDKGIKHWYFKQNEELQNLRGVSSDTIMATGPANSQHPVPLDASIS